ncbi:tetratricopeptide repeat protein [Mesorhizobium sp. ISC15]|uniref:tetratricopeptide repeat protein n=1 Tax=Mesorhizobium sp. ISC15 TaxID=3076429 RepID=UPI00301C9C29
MHDYYNLGRYSRPVTTSSSEAQVWFDRGLIWRYAFNHEEAVKCFRKAAECDPGCAMAHWGIAYALGPYYNKPWADFNEEDLKQTLVEARRATEDALALADGAAPVEKALIRGLERRYQSDHVADNENLRAWSDAYAGAMRKVYAAFPDDPDVAALFAEALMDRTPWQLWNLESGEPAEGADTVEVVAVLEQSLRLSDEREVAHPGLIHLYIHAMEMSPHPEQALRPADTLRDLVPDAGHLRHMPSHIDILCGDYHAALVANERAIEADRKYLEREGPFNFYTLSRCHDYHFKLYAAMFLGQYRPALDAANEMLATIPEALLRQATPPMAYWLEGYMPMKAHVLVRFGKWQEILDEPLPDDPDLYRATTAVWRALPMPHSDKQPWPKRSSAASRRRSPAFRKRACSSITATSTFWRSPRRCFEARLRIGRAITKRPSRISAPQWRGTTAVPMTSLGAGCSRRGTHLGPYSSNRATPEKRRRCMRRIWEWIVATDGSRGTPTTSGACTAMSKPCIGLAGTKRPTPFNLASIWRCRGPTSTFVRRAFAVSATTAARHDQRTVAGIARFSRETNVCAYPSPQGGIGALTSLSTSR